MAVTKKDVKPRKPRATAIPVGKKEEKKTSSVQKVTREKKKVEEEKVEKSPRDTPTKKQLGTITVTTEMYTGADVDALLAANRLIEDEDIPGDFYMLSIKSGRLIVRKVEENN